MEKNILITEMTRMLHENKFSEIEAAMIGGSIGRGQGDNLSDVDVFMLIDEALLKVFLNTRMKDFIEFLDETVLFRGPVLVSNFGYSYTVLYKSNFLFQYNVNSRATLTPNYMNSQPFVMIYDRTGYYTDYLQRSTISLDSDDTFCKALNFFWIRALSIEKELKRNNLWLSLRYMVDLRDQIIIMERIREKISFYGLNLGAPSKRVEMELSFEFNQFLRNTVCDCNHQSIAQALSNCVQWVCQITTLYIESINPPICNVNSQSIIDLAGRINKSLEAYIANE